MISKKYTARTWSGFDEFVVDVIPMASHPVVRLNAKSGPFSWGTALHPDAARELGKALIEIADGIVLPESAK